MMIDDEPIMVELVKTFLEDSGCREFIGVSDPRLAMDEIRAQRPDVLLLDLIMPDVDGFEILRQVRLDPNLADLPVIVLTSATDAQTKVTVLELAATDFLSKPVDPSELRLRLRNTLAFKAYRDRLAYFDALTGLPNRKLFMNQVATSLRRAKRNEKICGLLQIDLDRFKQINETLGHRAGDSLLKSVAERLQSGFRSLDLIARTGEENSLGWSISRIGGDEYMVLLQDMSRLEEVAAVAERIIKMMEQPFQVEGHDLYVTPSIGIATYPNDAQDAENLFKLVDSALTTAKLRGGNSFHFSSQKANDDALTRLTLESQLRRAIERREFVLHYQPKVDLSSGRIVGAEALVRWAHPERGLLSPDKFISIAEESNLISNIGAIVMEDAVRACAQWNNYGLRGIGVAVNVSTPQLRDSRLLGEVKQCLIDTRLAPSLLTIELTETIVMDSNKMGFDTFKALKAIGVKTSLDDFGTGYSSLAYLQRLPLDEIKIDRSFVSALPGNKDSAAIVSALLAMAQNLELSVTAEGVESEWQLAYLRSKGCDRYQGFFFSKPLPLNEFVLFTAERNGMTLTTRKAVAAHAIAPA
jgi:predicted signal transduction protein with EAL and GGDEF domain